MTVRTPPSWLHAGSHPAENDRLVLAGLLGSPLGTFTGGVGAVDPGHGVVRSGDLAVTANGTPNLTVNVAAGLAFIRGTQSSTQGVYNFANDATLNVTGVPAGDATNPTWHLVIAQARDTGYSGASDDARITLVTGTPSGSPADPSLTSFPNALVLARIVMPAGATNVGGGAGQGTITDLRVLAVPWYGATGIVAATAGGTFGRGYVRITSPQGTFTAATDITGATVTFSGLSTRLYEAFAQIDITSSVANDTAQMQMLLDGTAIATDGIAVTTAGTGGDRWLLIHTMFTTTTASHTIKLQASRSSGTGNLTMQASATNPAVFWVKDAGPA